MFLLFRLFDSRAPPGCVFAPRISAFSACVSLCGGLEKFRLAVRASPCFSFSVFLTQGHHQDAYSRLVSLPSRRVSVCEVDSRISPRCACLAVSFARTLPCFLLFRLLTKGHHQDAYSRLVSLPSRRVSVCELDSRNFALLRVPRRVSRSRALEPADTLLGTTRMRIRASSHCLHGVCQSAR